MTDAPKDEVALALFIHGMIKGRLGNAQGRLTDWKQVLELPGLPTWGRIEFAREMFAELWRVRQRTQAIEVLGRLYKWMATLETAQRVNAVLNLLTELAVPDMKEAWSVVWRNARLGVNHLKFWNDSMRFDLLSRFWRPAIRHCFTQLPPRTAGIRGADTEGLRSSEDVICEATEPALAACQGRLILLGAD